MALPEPLPLGFVTLRPRLGDAGLAELVLQAADHPFTDDGVTKMTDYIDDFLKYDLVKKGFSIVYDLRSLRVPSLSLVKQLADWGRDPERQQTFQRMNKICKVVVSEGWRFGVAKRILSAFFAMCPPVCDTFLLTAADQSSSEGLYFAPPETGKLDEGTASGAPPEPEIQPGSDAVGKGGMLRRLLRQLLDFLAEPSGAPLVYAAHFCPSISGPHA
ncbi:unnamed protein product [Effrenium voratum]|nr:unnamed protein product [Effrenium voratum]